MSLWWLVDAGYSSVTPRLFVADPQAQVEFLRAVFDASGEVHPGRLTELRIGDTLVLVGSTAEHGPFPAFLYIYVDDADTTYQRALKAGAISWSSRSTPRTAIVRDGAGSFRQRVPGHASRRADRVVNKPSCSATRHRSGNGESNLRARSTPTANRMTASKPNQRAPIGMKGRVYVCSDVRRAV